MHDIKSLLKFKLILPTSIDDPTHQVQNPAAIIKFYFGPSATLYHKIAARIPHIQQHLVRYIDRAKKDRDFIASVLETVETGTQLYLDNCALSLTLSHTPIAYSLIMDAIVLR